MRFTPSSNYKEMVEAAKELEVKYVGVSKYNLAIALNEKLDEIETEQNTVQLNLADAEDALTPTEFAILCQLLLKLDQAKYEMEMDEKINALAFDLFGPKKATIEGSALPLHPYGDASFLFHGVPGIGKSKNMEKWAKENGVNVIHLKFD